ncbi:MAG: ABC transporter substrate-binding protein [Caulobacteraceae bacterium]
MPVTLRVAALAIVLTTAAIAPLALTPTAAVAQATRDAQAEAFVQAETTRGLAILNNSSLGTEGKKQAFRTFVDQIADVPRITSFVLGKYNRTITPEQRQAFNPVFREYANSVYETRLGEYRGETLKVTGSTVRRPGDVIVTSQVTGGARREPAKVSWRVIQADGRWRVVDVEVSGVWLAITQQQDFVSTMDNAKGDVNVLIGQLKRQSAAGTAGAPARAAR